MTDKKEPALKKRPRRKATAPAKTQMKIELDPTSVFHMCYVNALATDGTAAQLQKQLQEQINELANAVGKTHVGRIGSLVGLASAWTRQTIDETDRGF